MQELTTIKTHLQAIDLRVLLEKGFIREENGGYFLMVDVTQGVSQNRTDIFIDSVFSIVNAEVEGKLAN